MKIALSSRMIVVALAVFIVTASGTLVAAKVTRDSELRTLQATFDERGIRSIGALHARLRSYEAIIRGGSGLIAAGSGSLPNRQQWREYVDSLHLKDDFPSVQALSVAPLITADRKAAFEAGLRSEGHGAIAIHPASDRNELAPLNLIEPDDAHNDIALGFDLLSEPARRDALLAARDSGQPTLTGRILLVVDQEPVQQAASLLVLPVYQKSAALETQQQRHDAAIGFIACVFRIRDLVSNVLGSSLLGIRLELYDQGNAQSSSLLFQSRMSSEEARHEPLFRLQSPIQFGGRIWLARFSSLPDFEQPADEWSYLVLIGGLTISFLLALVVLSLGTSERRAIRFAELTTRALRHSEQRHRAILSNTADGIFTTDGRGTLLTINPSVEAMFGYEGKEVLGRNLELLIPGWARDFDRSVADSQQSGTVVPTPVRGERMGRHKSGEKFPIELAINPMSMDGEQHLVGVVGDISERKRVQGMLAESNAFWKSVLDNSPVSIITFDPRGLLLSMNPAAERMLNYKAEDLVGKVSYLTLHDSAELRNRAAEMAVITEMPEPERALSILVHEARHGLVEEHEWTYVRRDGEQIPVRLTISGLTAAGLEISGFLAIAYDVTERKRSEEYSRHIAQHDFLTGLPNRLLLHERVNMAVEIAREDRTKVGVLLIDLDHFKRINDSLGHHVGDQLLQQLADRLCKLTGASDTVARMGGDEFVVLKADAHSSEEVLRFAVTLLRQISEPFALGQHELHVTPSIGLSVFPDDGQDMHTLLKNADAALYDAKENGRNRVQLFTAAMVMAASEKMDLEKALRAALQRQELSVHLQPLMNLATGQVDGAEALIRWHHPQRGWISPASFIPLAEQTGLIVPISDWMLSVACREMVALQAALKRPLTLAVNFSPRQFRDRGLAQYVEGVLKMCDMQPQHLELEITEGVLMANSDETLDMLRELHQIGVRISIDDFGTGYSSLSYLTRFKIDKLKIDRSFVRDIIVDPADAAVTNAIIAMAHGLGVKVVAEGIETLEQLSYLTRSGCDQGQGFYFSKAVPAKDFQRLVEELESERYRKVARFVFPGMKEGGPTGGKDRS